MIRPSLLSSAYFSAQRSARKHRAAQGEALAFGNDAAWDPESRNGEWFLCLGPGAGGGLLGWTARGPPLKLRPVRDWGGLSGKWVNRATWKTELSQLTRFPGGGILCLGVTVANSSSQIWFFWPKKIGALFKSFHRSYRLILQLSVFY